MEVVLNDGNVEQGKGVRADMRGMFVFLTTVAALVLRGESVPDWSDEFSVDGRPNPGKWDYEVGFVRNRELQWYQPENAYCSNGWLVIEARRERKENPNYDPAAPEEDWRRSRTHADYTSACVITKDRKAFKYGRIDIRAKIVAEGGLWPALWLLGESIGKIRWPACGEVDILEYYNDCILANFIYADNPWGKGVKPAEPGRRLDCRTNTSEYALPGFRSKDPHWCEKWHVWSISWTDQLMAIYLDGELLNVHVVEQSCNPSFVEPRYPYREPMYLLMNLALAKHPFDAEAEPQYPSRFLIDYVRYYKDAGLVLQRTGSRGEVTRR